MPGQPQPQERGAGRGNDSRLRGRATMSQMADSLYLSLWFPSFQEEEMMPRTLGVMRQFPFSAVREGITYLSVHPVAWSEPTVLERRFSPGISPEEAAEVAGEFAHDDFAFVFEAFWDLWLPSEDEHGETWVQRPVAVRF